MYLPIVIPEISLSDLGTALTVDEEWLYYSTELLQLLQLSYEIIYEVRLGSEGRCWYIDYGWYSVMLAGEPGFPGSGSF